MNDCVYCFIQACNGEQCNNCNKYFSINAPEASIIYEAYQADINEALAPVYAKWKDLFEKGEIV